MRRLLLTRGPWVLVSIAALTLVAHAGQGAPAPAGPRIFDVRDFGATGDGRTLDTAAINKAIDAAAAAGGGTVSFPAGAYLSFSIHLKSHVALFLDQGATIVAADPKEGGGGYDAPEPNPWDQYQDFGHSHWHNSLIWGEGVEDVSILGPGRLWGKGLTRSGDPTPGVGNKTIALKQCRNVVIRDISILQAGHFGILATGVDNLTIDNLKIDTNRDGMNIDACRNVRISNCTVNSPNDDGICLKSSYGLGVLRATENVTITNSQVSGYDVGTFLDGTFRPSAGITPEQGGATGRIKFGTESNGGFKNITIANIVFDHCRGLALESVDGGLMEDVTITNITMRDIVNAPIFIRLGARLRGPDKPPVGVARRINISNIVAYNVAPDHGILISGLPDHPIEDVSLSNIRIVYQGGGTKEQAARDVPEYEQEYPEPSRFGTIPSWGMFARHVRGLELSNVEISFMKDDLRPAFMLDDVKGAEFRFIKAPRVADVPTFVLKNVEDFTVYQSRPVPDTRLERVEQKSF